MRAGLLCLVTLAALVVVASAHPLDTSFPQDAGDSSASLIREKRTVGVLRQLFPNFSQFVDRAVAMVTRLVFRVVGRLVLQGGGGLGGGGGGGGGGDGDGGGEGRISITLPTYPPLPDDDEDEDTTDEESSSDATTTAASAQTTANDEENAVAESNVSPVRAKREAAEESDDEEEDLESEATGDNNEVNDEEEEEAESEDEEDPRNKRFLNFNLGGTASATTGAGSGGGSGNFIFDIIRLIAGSGTTAEGDEAANGPDGAAKDAEGNYGVGVPGPLTRLFVIANRGVASLIQDLILRMAQTSERLVNFKARLITSII